ncbi:HxxPF-repeated domain-containing protein [Chitinophaga sp. CF118]|uniref:condensation domain-containing protein n=1 Tax=Chitinophaga sp. CF118 TaxID=1884367 RepID=UPI0008E2AA6A|nr:condensation domain-containing protein [Chitinophaga sp. CF118]SFF04125.1 HxxPF-repeated domain-containing protein [Chitinophaga sp. CF118]
MIEPLNICISEKLRVGTSAADIPEVLTASSYELSHAQKRVWSVYQNSEEKLKGNRSFFSLIEGALNMSILEKAVETVLARHDSLRTTFFMLGETPYQQVCPAESFHFRINHIDISNYENKKDLSNEIIQEEHTYAFDFLDGFLLRITLIRNTETSFILMFSMHHIISDDWSKGILVQELFTIYNAYRQDLENPLSPLRIQYKDFISWQNSLLQGEYMGKLENYWLNRFNNKPEPVKLPADFPEDNLLFYSESCIELEMSSHLIKALNNTAKSNDTSLFAVLMAITSILLNRYTGRQELIMGTPVTSRIHPELDEQVGLYIDIIPVSIHLNEEKDTFSYILGKVKQTLHEALEHGLYPYDMLMEKLGLVNHAPRLPFINILMQSQSMQQIMLPEIPDLSIKSYSHKNLTGQVDITFNFKHSDSYLKAGVEYNAGLFKRSTITQIIDDLIYITETVLANNDMLLSDISLIENEERK